MKIVRAEVKVALLEELLRMERSASRESLTKKGQDVVSIKNERNETQKKGGLSDCTGR
jgi:hypothetical protein